MMAAAVVVAALMMIVGWMVWSGEKWRLWKEGDSVHDGGHTVDVRGVVAHDCLQECWFLASRAQGLAGEVSCGYSDERN